MKVKKRNITVRPYAWSFDGDNVPTWASVPNMFTAEECKKIIEIGNKLNPSVAVVGNNKGTKEIRTRNSFTSWIGPSDDAKWIYEKVTRVVTSVNKEHFKFNLFGLTEGFQFTKYNAPDGHYTAHIDKMYKGPIRKLSLTVQLTDPKKYKGGELTLYEGVDPTLMPKELGMGLLFPSYVLHRVTPVKKGTRYSLVAWFTGKNFT